MQLSILLAYCRACTWAMTGVVLLMFLFTNMASVGGNFWLATWSNAEERAVSGDFNQSNGCDGENSTLL